VFTFVEFIPASVYEFFCVFTFVEFILASVYDASSSFSKWPSESLFAVDLMESYSSGSSG